MPAFARRDPSHAAAARLQRSLSDFYRLDGLPAIADFLRDTDTENETREAIHVASAEDGALEIAVFTPPLSLAAPLDRYCQIIEGVSHFLFLAERARTELPVTELELELQAEIDKYLVLVWLRERIEHRLARSLHRRLYESVTFLHPQGTEKGDRYRLANDLAARLVDRLGSRYAVRGRMGELRDTLVRFHRMGQCAKLSFARAA